MNRKVATSGPEAQEGYSTLISISSTRAIRDRKNLGIVVDWLQKGILYGPANKLPQNVQNIKWSHKLYRENHENLKNGIGNRKEEFIWSEDTKRYIPRRCNISVIICNSDDAHSTTYSGNAQPTTNLLITGKDQSPNIHGRHQIGLQKIF